MTTAPLPYQSVRAYIHGMVVIPGDKSISHRALMLASQVTGAVKIGGLLEAEDVHNTADALRNLGVSMERTAPGQWVVHGNGIGSLRESANVLEMGNSGTSTRLLIGLVSPYPFSTTFNGDASLIKRPMTRVMKPLEQMGAKFSARKGGLLPLTVTGTDTPTAITYELPVASAQVKSAILLAGLNTQGNTVVIEPTPSRDHTEHMLAHLGFKLNIVQKPDGRHITLPGRQSVRADGATIHVPSDPSSAAFPLVAALICPDSEITIPNVCVNPLRIGLINTLLEMGANITLHNKRTVGNEPVADISARTSKLKGVAVPPLRAPSMIDEYLILAVAAAFAEGETVLTGLAELRVKESDRLGAIVTGLSACGVQVKAEGDTLHINGSKKPAGGATIATNGDHRVAMSFLVMGMASKGPVTVDDITPIATSFPHFVDIMNSAGAKISAMGPTPRTDNKPLVIAVDGPAASGKGTLARRLAEHYGLEYLDTGSLYRAVGMKLVYNDQDPNDKKAAIEAARSIDTNDLANPRLRQEHIGQAASIVSSYPEVRTALLDYQRKFAKGKYHISSPYRGEDGWGAQKSHNYPLEKIKKNARLLRKSMSDAESLLWESLRRQQFGVKFRKQHPVGKYIADFACLNPAVVIELDGGQHAEEKNISKDQERTKFLESKGFTVLRFWNDEVLKNTEAVLESIYSAIHKTPCPPPSLPPTEGGTFKGAVLDGRDIGTVVCPDADFKFFITATLFARAKRRHKELSGEGIEVVFDSVLEDLRERDERDEKRTVAPLIPASDAIIMDTSTLDASEVFEKACEVVDAKLAS